MRRRSCSCRTLLFFAAFLNIFTDLPVLMAIGALFFERGFTKFENLRVVQVGDQFLRFSASGSSPEGKVPCSGGSRTAQSTS